VEERVLEIQARKRALISKAFSGIRNSGEQSDEKARAERIADLSAIFAE
jgi:SNF2 family DNA or RNA helicase